MHAFLSVRFYFYASCKESGTVFIAKGAIVFHSIHAIFSGLERHSIVVILPILSSVNVSAVVTVVSSLASYECLRAVLSSK